MVFRLSSFQREKLTYYFNFFAPNEENHLDSHSIDNFMQRVLQFTGWDRQSPEAQEFYEIHKAFFEILFDKTSDPGTSSKVVTLDDWFLLWANLLPGCMSLASLPVWLRLLPKMLFRMMDRKKDEVLDKEELCDFYSHMIHLSEDEARNNATLAFNQMTDHGRYPLNASSYEQIFSNFLLGQTPYGPGRHIFGCFEHSVSQTPFTLIKPAQEEEDTELDIKIYMEKRPKRMSLAGI